MLILTSNEPEQFDWAVHDRLNKMVQFNLPSLDQSYRMIYLYFNIYILKSTKHH